MATVAVVGLRHGRHAAASRRASSARWPHAGINIVAIAQGSSELNISFVVEERDAAEAQRRDPRRLPARQDRRRHGRPAGAGRTSCCSASARSGARSPAHVRARGGRGIQLEIVGGHRPHRVRVRSRGASRRGACRARAGEGEGRARSDGPAAASRRHSTRCARVHREARAAATGPGRRHGRRHGRHPAARARRPAWMSCSPTSGRSRAAGSTRDALLSHGARRTGRRAAASRPPWAPGCP